MIGAVLGVGNSAACVVDAVELVDDLQTVVDDLGPGLHFVLQAQAEAISGGVGDCVKQKLAYAVIGGHGEVLLGVVVVLGKEGCLMDASWKGGHQLIYVHWMHVYGSEVNHGSVLLLQM